MSRSLRATLAAANPTVDRSALVAAWRARSRIPPRLRGGLRVAGASACETRQARAMQRNPELERVAAIFVGEWTVSITDQWWLDDPSTVTTGSARCEWLGDSFLRLEAELDGKPTWDFVFGRSDARDELVVLYNDERGVQRVFDLTINETAWEMSRRDPDFHQRLNGRLEGNRMVGTADASEDEGTTWREDFDLIFELRP
jgi:hypothetical protein